MNNSNWINEYYQNYFTIIVNLKNRNRNLFQLDSTEKASLYQMSQNNINPVAAYARNILILADNLAYEEPIIFTNHQMRGQHNYNNNVPDQEETYLKVYPSPAHDYFTIEYKLNAINPSSLIKITDVKGNLINQLLIRESQNQIVINTKLMAPGTYFCDLYLNNKKIDSQKISVIK